MLVVRDENWFRGIYAETYRPVLAFARRRVDSATADEVVAETFLTAWRRREEVPDGSERLWLFGVARNGDLYDFVDLGQADLDGIAVAHYRTDETPAGAGADMLMSLGMIMMTANQAPISGPERVQLDVWVDSDNLIRRVSYSAVIEGTGSFGVVTEWGSFGQAPPITAPAN